MKRLALAAALLASLAACMSWHPSNNGPARDTSDRPQGYAQPAQ